MRVAIFEVRIPLFCFMPSSAEHEFLSLSSCIRAGCQYCHHCICRSPPRQASCIQGAAFPLFPASRRHGGVPSAARMGAGLLGWLSSRNFAADPRLLENEKSNAVTKDSCCKKERSCKEERPCILCKTHGRPLAGWQGKVGLSRPQALLRK